jgi:hypothetical protein
MFLIIPLSLLFGIDTICFAVSSEKTVRNTKQTTSQQTRRHSGGCQISDQTASVSVEI